MQQRIGPSNPGARPVLPLGHSHWVMRRQLALYPRIRNGPRFLHVLAFLQWVLSIKTKPMWAIGEVAALSTALAFVVLSIFGVDFGPAAEAASP